MKKIAIVFDSHDGHTQRISEKIQDIITQRGGNARLIHISQFSPEQLTEFDFIAFGSPIRYGKHLPDMVAFLQRHQTTLQQYKTAFFSVNLTARKPNRNTPETSNYLKKFMASMDWQPDIIEVFAGKLNYPMYRFFDKLMIRFIMWITKGPTDANTVVDYTNWQHVSDFADTILAASQAEHQP